MSELPDPDLLSIAEELYGLPLADFTPARDAKVKEVKGTPLAPEVKALRKPSLAAWVVNLLVRHDTEQVDQVLAVGAALREAQASMSADELRTLTRQRRQLTAAVTTGARRIAREAGTRVTDSVAEQVEATLTAAMVDEQAGLALRSGLLVAPLSATGVDPADVAAAVAAPEALGFAASPVAAVAPTRPELHVVPDPEADAKAVAAAEQALEAAERTLDEASEAHEEAADAVARLEARSLQIQAEIAELRAKIDELETAAEEIDDELGEAEDLRAEAESELTAATRARDAAAAALAKLR